MQLKIKHIILVGLILTFVGCDKLIYDSEPDSSEPKVHLSVNIKAAQTKSGMRSSINLSDIYEDHVYSLAMLVFNSGDGSIIGSLQINNNLGSGLATHAFTVELIAGRQYDFYFVANIPNMETELNGITNKTAMDNYLSDISRELNNNLYLGATDNLGFPMARVYRNQLVSSGGTVYQPTPFKPKQDVYEVNKVVVNTAGNGADERDFVELIRVVAKLEVNFDDTNDLGVGVNKVYFRNANRHFRLVEFDTAPQAYFNDNSTNVELKQLPGTNTFIYYMPEAINVNNVTWSEGAANKPVNYFTVATHGVEYDIPIISNETTITSDYLAKAKGTFPGFVPNYDIYRNHHYKYVIKNLEKIEIIYKIDPWNLVKKSTYMGYGYNVEVDEDGSITITNTIDDCMPHVVRLKAINGAYFGTSDVTEIKYGYESESDVGFNINSSKAGYSEKFQVNADAVASGAYLEVYYNKLPGVGVTPDKVFTK